MNHASVPYNLIAWWKDYCRIHHRNKTNLSFLLFYCIFTFRESILAGMYNLDWRRGVHVACLPGGTSVIFIHLAPSTIHRGVRCNKWQQAFNNIIAQMPWIRYLCQTSSYNCVTVALSWCHHAQVILSHCSVFTDNSE